MVRATIRCCAKDNDADRENRTDHLPMFAATGLGKGTGLARQRGTDREGFCSNEFTEEMF